MARSRTGLALLRTGISLRSIGLGLLVYFGAASLLWTVLEVGMTGSGAAVHRGRTRLVPACGKNETAVPVLFRRIGDRRRGLRNGPSGNGERRFTVMTRSSMTLKARQVCAQTAFAILLEWGILTEEQLAQALRAAGARGIELEKVLLEDYEVPKQTCSPRSPNITIVPLSSMTNGCRFPRTCSRASTENVFRLQRLVPGHP